MALLLLRDKAEAQNRTARLEEVKEIQQNHEFFKGNQNIFWNAQQNRWLPISSNGASSLPSDTEEEARYDFVTNIYGPNCMIDAATLTANPPSLEFMPKDPQRDSDIATAKAAEDCAEYIADNNKLELKAIDLAFLMFNDGGASSYTRFEIDAKKYGTTQQPRMAQMPAKITPDALRCAKCGFEHPLPEGWQEHIQEIPDACPQCGAPLGPQNVQPGPMGMVPKVVGVDEIPNGQVVISYYSYLEVERPFSAKSQDEFGWIRFDSEVPKPKLKAMFPEVAEKIATTSGDATSSASRMARIALASTSYGRNAQEASANLVTFSRLWFRPWQFYELDDMGLTKQLLQLFPDGCYVAFAGTTYCDSRNEDMDDVWQVMHAMPGDGQIRQSLGRWFRDVQRRFNTEQNIMTETFERGISSRFMDPDSVDIDAYQDGGSLPGSTMAAKAPPGGSISDVVFDTQPVQASDQMTRHSEELMGNISQFVTSNHPEVFGGDTGSNDTASGIKTIKDSAMGVKALYKIPMNEFYAKTMMNAIKCLQKNQKQDIVIAIQGADGEFDSKIIKLDQIKGNITVRTDVNASYPMSVSAQREMVAGMLANPSLEPLLLSPKNADALKLLLGAKMLRFPNEEARQRQNRALRAMCDGVAVPVNPLLDDHDTAVMVNKEWWSSEDGQRIAMQGNQNAVELVMQNTIAHLTAKMAQQAPPPGAGPVPPPGAGPEANAPPSPPVQ